MSKSKWTQRYRTIPLPKIAVYSQCPKKYEYSQHLPPYKPKSEEVGILKSIVKMAYNNKARTGFLPAWRAVTGIIDKHIFKDVDVDNEKEFNQAYRKSKKHIDMVKNTWFDKYFTVEDYDGLVDMKMGMLVGNTVIHDTIDLILYNEKDLIVCNLTDIEQDTGTLYNDIRLRGQALLLSKELDKFVNKIRYITWKEAGKISIQDINIYHPEEFMEKTEKSILHMVQGIRDEVFYTSVSEQCFTCPFKQTCSM